MEVPYKTFTDMTNEINLRGNDNMSPNTHKSERNGLLNEKVSENEEQKTSVYKSYYIRFCLKIIHLIINDLITN